MNLISEFMNLLTIKNTFRRKKVVFPDTITRFGKKIDLVVFKHNLKYIKKSAFLS